MQDQTAVLPLDSEPATGQRPTRVRYGVVAFLCVLAFITYFDRVCITRAQEDISHDLGITKTQMGFIMGAFWFAYALFEIPSGWLGDRYGARSTLTRVVLAWSVFTAMSGTATGFISLLAYRFLFGVGEAGAFPNMARIQAAWLPTKARARAGGLLWLCARWGGAFSPLLFGLMLSGFGSGTWHRLTDGTWLQGVAPWRMGFVASGLVGLVWIAAFFYWFRDNPAEKRGVNAAELALIREGRSAADLAAHHHTFPGMWKALFTSKPLWLIACVYICGSFGWSFFVSWCPVYFKDRFNINMKDSAIMAGLPLFCGGISCFVGGSLSDYLVKRTGRKRLFRAIFPLCGDTTAGLAMFGLLFAQTPTQATVLLCVAAVGHDFGQPINWASIVDIGGRFAGTAFGFINMVGNIGNTIQPPIGGLIVDSYTINKVVQPGAWNTMFIIYGCVFITGACMWFFIDPTHRFYREQDQEPKPDPRRGFEVVRKK